MNIAQHLNEEHLSLLERGTPVLLPDINRSVSNMSVDDNCLRLGFDSVWGLSREEVGAILHERENAPFNGLCDFLGRIPRIHRNNDGLTNLIRCGAFDSFGQTRTSLLNWNCGEDPQRTLELLDEYWDCEMQLSAGSEISVEDPVVPKPMFRVFSQIEKRITCREIHETAWLMREMENQALLDHPVEIQLAPYKKALRIQHSERSKDNALVCYGRISRIEGVYDVDELTKRKGYIVNATFEDAYRADRIRFVLTKKAFKGLHLCEGCLVRIRVSPKSSSGGAVSIESIKRMPPAREMMKKATVTLKAQELTSVRAYRLKTALEYCSGMDSVCLNIVCTDGSFSAELPVRVNTGYAPFRAYLHEIFGNIKIDVTFDEDIYDPLCSLSKVA
ncbi:hypothetical protein [Anaerotardibacter muris]|uniref:helix-hairpin-helix domain-containing protein n=1 Tax=Anaerotardibacter muris TaxID=2941505 RepID=UPI00203AB35C|nr:hypothetical protein [Anaerotardibacter muris]